MLQVTDKAVPSVASSWIKISEFAVTAVEAIVTVVAAAAIETRPAEADVQVPPADAQFVVVVRVGDWIFFVSVSPLTLSNENGVVPFPSKLQVNRVPAPLPLLL